MFQLIARILEFFYTIVPSYGFAILALTSLVMMVVMPLTFRSTKSMIEMRRIQPKIKKVQAAYADDREKLNQELMKLYQENGVNPVGSCFPMLIQGPVFFVLYRVVFGITRREVDTGWAVGNLGTKAGLAESGAVSSIDLVLDAHEPANFNPQYVKPDSAMGEDLFANNDMDFLGVLDLARSPYEVLGDSIPGFLPYLVVVLATGVLSWYQQRQIQGRMGASAEINPQMQMITKVLPFLTPVFAFSLPAALGLYFVGSALFRVIQQGIITRRYYGDDALVADDDDWEPPEVEGGTTSDASTPAAPQSGLAALLGGGTAGSSAPSNRHGSRRPTSTSKKPAVRAPRATPATPAATSRTTPAKSKASATAKRTTSAGAKAPRSTKNAGSKRSANAEAGSGSLWSRARRGAEGKAADVQDSAPTKPQSKRVTPKGTSSNNRKKK